MSKSKFTKVTMNLTEKDVDNTVALKNRLHTRSNAEAVSAALSITSSLSNIVKEGDELLIKKKSGDIEKIIITGLNN